MQSKQKRLLGLALGLLTAGISFVPSASAVASVGAHTADNALTGAGSTLVAPLMAHWSQDFQQRYGISVTYGAVGSGAGIAQISSRSVDFGASDAPLTPSQFSACNGCVQIPWALTATGIAFHLNGVRRLNLTGSVLAGIYMGQIRMWNDRRIASLNKGAHLPAVQITPAFRSDGSGDTYAFTDYLSRVSPAWKRQIGNSTAVSFPVGVGGKGNDGVTAVVQSTNGAIGYISAAYIIAHGLDAAAVRNAAGKFQYPNLSNIEAAAQALRRVPANNEMHIVNPPAKARNAYPISTFTYVIVPKVTPKKALLVKLIDYALSAGQRFGPALDFAPIPRSVLNAGTATARRFQQG